MITCTTALRRDRSSCKGRIDKIGGDDDLIYTELGLLILEEYGPDFTPADVGAAWLKYLPMACTAEDIALKNLKKGMKPPATADKDNPYVDWIGADIRSDPWGYAAPGWPERAAEYAWRDAVVSHKATGIHGEMFFSAVIAAAFAVDDPIEAIKIGLTEIPKDCRTAEAVRSALAACRKDNDWDKTTDRILARYKGMSMAHTLNNAELTVAGLYYGEKDFGRTIALTVMGGEDTDCTGATAGSILGAVLGAKRLSGQMDRRLWRPRRELHHRQAQLAYQFHRAPVCEGCHDVRSERCASPGLLRHFVAETCAHEPCALDQCVVLRDALRASGHLFDRHVGDFAVLVHDHPVVLAVCQKPHRLRPEPRRDQSVITAPVSRRAGGTRGPSRACPSRPVPVSLLRPDSLTKAPKPQSSWICPFPSFSSVSSLSAASVDARRPLCHDDDGELLALSCPVDQMLRDYLRVVRDFRY